MTQRLIELWQMVRAIATDDAYEKYLAHQKQAHADAPPLSRKEFYVGEQQRKWTGVSRCC